MRKGIETVYADTRFRSRLEATWAAFFDRLGWPWVYEPEDLNGYVPDFVLKFGPAPVLVEVKPEYHRACLEEHAAKIDASGWRGEALIVGADWHVTSELDDALPCIGLLRETSSFDDDTLVTCWASGKAILCAACGRPSFAHAEWSYHCRACGANDGGGHWFPFGGWAGFWADAKNAVRWLPGTHQGVARLKQGQARRPFPEDWRR